MLFKKYMPMLAVAGLMFSNAFGGWEPGDIRNGLDDAYSAGDLDGDALKILGCLLVTCQTITCSDCIDSLETGSSDQSCSYLVSGLANCLSSA
jgi:hypothetical protein